jgi:hypothetical protein
MMDWSFTLLATATDSCQKSDFFGLIPWYHYLSPDHFSGCSLLTFNLLPSSGAPSDVPLVLLAIIDDLLRVAGAMAVIFVIVGAIRYITSQGNPEDTSKAQSTIVNALTGLAVAITAAVFVSYLGNKLGG